MKKEVMILFLLGILLVSPLVLAQDQAQIYSGFDRFIDNVKMFFSSGDNKVMLALEIREKELNSAIINTQNGNDEEAEKNLERARVRLRFVQNKVSENIAEDVKTNVDETMSKINEKGDLPDSFDAYILEEEKTGLIAELVIEVRGKEGQTLTREMVEDSESGENKVEIVVEGDGSGENKVGVEGRLQEQIQEQTRTREIENRIDEIDDEIAEGVIQIAAGTNVVESGMDIDGGGDIDDTTPKTPAGDVDDGPCKEGEEDCNDDGMAPQGIMGVFVPEPRDDGAPFDSVDSSEGDSDGGDDGGDSAPVTGEVIRDSDSNNFIRKIFNWLF